MTQEEGEETHAALHRSSACSLTPGLSNIPAGGRRLDYDPALLSYFEQIICSSCTLVDNAHYNPYRYLILPMALESEGLYHATLAQAANTLRLSDPQYRLAALEHHHRALNYLRELLKLSYWADKELDEMLGLVLMLYWFDISDNSRPSWVTHLKGFQDLIQTRQQRPGRSAHSQELTCFFSRYFAFHLVLARTAFQMNSLPSYQDSTIPGKYLDSPDTIDTYMGFTHSLLLLINEVADLAGIPDDASSIVKAMDVYQLKKRIETIDQKPPIEFISPDTECAAIAEANRLGALLLLHEICSSKSGQPDYSYLPSFNPDEKDRYVEQILQLILSKKANMMRTAALPLWPLFLAGCCTRNEEERVTVLKIFEEVESIRRFGNVAPALEVVQMVWRQKDLAVQDERKRFKNGHPRNGKDSLKSARFSWEYAMTMLGGWKVSLT
ncbi:uncharacterized protein N7483_002323 [Penicillium malachiteum]|uniref:uncharacterized protein n=1 Tax=Penicillium malachiteum TaxID=1324776 RepID=UPI002546A4F8|nr:uncharacterized protein N7483_002323 [Penicillium malachiteum]KAJ5737198.1 hypothetical protein N7483_002323 [Penicillium malachiteum]